MARFMELKDTNSENLTAAIWQMEYNVKQWAFALSPTAHALDGLAREPTPEDRADLADETFNVDALAQACKVLNHLRDAWEAYQELEAMLDEDEDEDQDQDQDQVNKRKEIN